MTTVTRLLSVALTALCLLAGTAYADDLTAADRDALKVRIADFETAFTTGDIEAVIGVVPPPILQVAADRFGMPLDELRRAMIAATEQAMEAVNVLSFDMDLGTAREAVSSDGRPYALIPTTTVLETDGEKVQSETSTLAFADAGICYLVRIDNEQQIVVLRQAYPEFSDVEFPRGEMKVIE